MGLTGTLVAKTEIKSCGDLFHELYRTKPHHISNISPHHVQGCELHDGEFGTVGSLIVWNYFHDGKAKVAKEVIEAIDEEKRLVSFKVVEGDLMDIFKSFLITVHVDSHGDNNLVTWTLQYEKLNENVPDPYTFLELLLNVTKDIETHHLK